jgi:hypothetical protein
MDGLLDIWGGPPSKLGIPKYVPIQWQHKLGKPYEFPSGYSASLNTPAPTSAYHTEFEEIPVETDSGKPAGHSLPAATSAVGDGFEDIPEDKPAGHSLPAPTSAYGTEFESEPTTVVPIPAQGFDDTGATLQDLLKEVKAGGGDGVVIINDATGDIKAELHDEEVHGPAHKATTWEKLTPKQREGWKKKLSEAGHWAEEWAEETGNAIWKGVLFSEIAGAIGQAVAG